MFLLLWRSDTHRFLLLFLNWLFCYFAFLLWSILYQCFWLLYIRRIKIFPRRSDIFGLIVIVSLLQFLWRFGLFIRVWKIINRLDWRRFSHNWAWILLVAKLHNRFGFFLFLNRLGRSRVLGSWFGLRGIWNWLFSFFLLRGWLGINWLVGLGRGNLLILFWRCLLILLILFDWFLIRVLWGQVLSCFIHILRLFLCLVSLLIQSHLDWIIMIHFLRIQLWHNKLLLLRLLLSRSYFIIVRRARAH